jgi:hypothetical protein
MLINYIQFFWYKKSIFEIEGQAFCKDAQNDEKYAGSPFAGSLNDKLYSI